MRTGGISSSDIRAEGARLTGAYHLSEDQVAVATMRQSHVPTVRLGTLVAGRGIFRGPIFSRRFVEDPAFGVPYVSAKDLVMADVRPSGYLARSHGDLLDDLRLREGMILITCSGMNLGRAIWTRRDLDGLVASHDLIRVCPDATSIPPGYLHGFLSSRYGHAFIRKQIYGGNIKHIEPHHIAGIPVPRLDDKVELEAHRLVEEAAKLRSEASELLAEAVRNVEQLAALEPLAPATSPTPFSCIAVPATAAQERFDAFFHSPYGNQVVSHLRNARIGTITVGQLANAIVEPNRFKRIRIDDPAFGVRFFGTTSLISGEPIEMYFLPKNQQGIQQYIVTERTVLIPRSGQLSGIIGTAVLPFGDILGGAVSEDAIRIHCENANTAGFVFVALTSQYGLRQLKARAYGSSIPHLDVHQIGRVVLPDPGASERKRIGKQGAKVAELRHAAVLKEREARALVERAIEEAA